MMAQNKKDMTAKLEWVIVCVCGNYGVHEFENNGVGGGEEGWSDGQTCLGDRVVPGARRLRVRWLWYW